MKIRSVEAELFHADRRVDGETERHDEANSCFSQFCEGSLRMMVVFCVTTLQFTPKSGSVSSRLEGVLKQKEIIKNSGHKKCYASSGKHNLQDFECM